MTQSDSFAHLAFSNIPLENLLEEFLVFGRVLTEDSFRQALRSAGVKSVPTPLFDWHGQAADLLTLIVQRAILGLESYVIGAVWLEAGKRGALTSELNRKIRNPFSIKRGAGAAESYHHHLPSLLSPELSLQRHHAAFWEEVKAFYRQVRNPLFHGQELQTTDPEDILPCMSVIHFTYRWIATWHPLEVTKLRPRYVVFRPKR